MIFLWNIKTIFVGFLFGIGMALGLFLIAEKLIVEMQLDDPDDEFINSDSFKYLMKYIMPLVIIIGSSIVIGPIFVWGYNYLMDSEVVLGLDSQIFYILAILAFSLILDIAVFASRTPFPLFKLAANTWMFLILGLFLHLMMQ